MGIRQLDSFTVTAMPDQHPGAIKTGSTVRFGPVHCVSVHGGCGWCHAHGYMVEKPAARCGCGLH